MIQILLILPLLAVPVFVKTGAILAIFVFSYLLATMAIGLNLNFGFSGQLNMFTAASFGTSAYVTFLSTQYFGVSFWVGLIFAFIIVAMLSVVIGWICLRFGLKDFYFALITMAFSELVRLLILNWTDVTKGAVGLAVLDNIAVTLPGLGSFEIVGEVRWYYTAFAIMFLALVVKSIVVSSWVGRCFAAIRLNEDLALTLGINIFRYKLLAFVVADLMAALAGAFFAYYSNFIEPHNLSITQGLDALTMTLLGGSGTIVGPVIGALILTGLPHVIEIGAVFRTMLIGGIMIAVILFLPRGLFGTALDLLRSRKHAA